MKWPGQLWGLSDTLNKREKKDHDEEIQHPIMRIKSIIWGEEKEK